MTATPASDVSGKDSFAFFADQVAAADLLNGQSIAFDGIYTHKTGCSLVSVPNNGNFTFQVPGGTIAGDSGGASSVTVGGVSYVTGTLRAGPSPSEATYLKPADFYSAVDAMSGGAAPASYLLEGVADLEYFRGTHLGHASIVTNGSYDTILSEGGDQILNTGSGQNDIVFLPSAVGQTDSGATVVVGAGNTTIVGGTAADKLVVLTDRLATSQGAQNISANSSIMQLLGGYYFYNDESSASFGSSFEGGPAINGYYYSADYQQVQNDAGGTDLLVEVATGVGIANLWSATVTIKDFKAGDFGLSFQDAQPDPAPGDGGQPGDESGFKTYDNFDAAWASNMARYQGQVTAVSGVDDDAAIAWSDTSPRAANISSSYLGTALVAVKAVTAAQPFGSREYAGGNNVITVPNGGTGNALQSGQTVNALGTGDTVGLAGVNETVSINSGRLALWNGSSATVTGSGNVITLGASTSLTLSGSNNNISCTIQGGTINVSSGSSNTIGGGGAALSITGNAAVIVTGQGYAVNISGNNAALGLTGTSVSLSSNGFGLSGASSVITVNTNTTLAGSVSVGQQADVLLSGGYLLTSGAATFSGFVTGTQRLYAEGNTVISGLSIGGTVVFEVTAVATQSGGSVTVGDASGNTAVLLASSGSTYNITDDSGIVHGSATSSYIQNAGLFEKTGSTGTSTISASFISIGSVTAATGTLAFTGPSNSFAGAISGGGAVQWGGGTTQLNNGATATVSNLSMAGSGTLVTVAENLTYAHSFTQSSGTTLNVASGDTLTLSGATSLSGSVSGAGTLYFGGGGVGAFQSGATASIARLYIGGVGTTMTIAENLSYSGIVMEAGGSIINLTGGYLLLTGATALAGTVSGSQRLYAEGATTVSKMTIGGTAVVVFTATVSQANGTVTVGDASGTAATLYNYSGATYSIADNSSISRGTATNSYILNQGTLQKTGGAGVSTITPNIVNNLTAAGTLAVTSGTLDRAIQRKPF